MNSNSTSESISWLAVYTLAKRELVRFLRQRNRVFGALAQPLIFWFLFGIGLSASFVPGGNSDISYVAYFFPGTVVLVLLFTAIFATISIIEDRNEGFMQSVLVAPVSTSSIILGKLTGTTILAVGQGLLLFLFAPLAGIPLTITSTILGIFLLTVIAFGLAALGTCIAWRMDSTQGFHAIMMSFLMPLWFLSGAFFPTDGLPTWLGWVIRLNPLSYGVAALRRSFYLGMNETLPATLPGLAFSTMVSIVAAAAMYRLALWIASDRTRGISA